MPLFRNFFPKYKLFIVWNWFITKIILILQKYFFWSYSKWWQIKQSAPSLNRGLSSKFWWLRITNHIQFTDEHVMSKEKHVLIKKIFTNKLNMGLILWAWVETNLLSSKEKVPDTAASKEEYVDCFLWHERTHHFWFPWNRC